MTSIVGSWFRPVTVGARRFPGVGLIVLAAIGGSLLAIVAATEWRHFNDEHAYWLAGARLAAGAALYDPSAVANTPFAYWYPPPLAQVLAPITAILSADAFSVLWTILLLGALWWLGGRNPFVALALIAFLPVTIELRVRNIHLLLAVLIVLALRRSWAFWIPAAAIKITPVLGCAYLAAAGRWWDAGKVAILGAAVLGVSVALGPGAWREFIDIVGARAGTDGGSWLAIPFPVRFGLGLALALLAGRLAGRARRRLGEARLEGRGDEARLRDVRAGEILLVVALTVANPTLWATALSLLIAIVPLWRTAPAALAEPAPALRSVVSAA